MKKKILGIIAIMIIITIAGIGTSNAEEDTGIYKPTIKSRVNDIIENTGWKWTGRNFLSFEDYSNKIIDKGLPKLCDRKGR